MTVEEDLLRLSLKDLPTALRSIVESHLNAYNLVQREVDGRALNFYRIKRGLPTLPQSLDGFAKIPGDAWDCGWNAGVLSTPAAPPGENTTPPSISSAPS